MIASRKKLSSFNVRIKRFLNLRRKTLEGCGQTIWHWPWSDSSNYLVRGVFYFVVRTISFSFLQAENENCAFISRTFIKISHLKYVTVWDAIIWSYSQHRITTFWSFITTRKKILVAWWLNGTSETGGSSFLAARANGATVNLGDIQIWPRKTSTRPFITFYPSI